MRGATRTFPPTSQELNISIHAPHAGRDNARRWAFCCCQISIHAPHAGRDNSEADALATAWGFQSTRPMRGATTTPEYQYAIIENVNPRAPCGARPFTVLLRNILCTYFNPRAPCGARQACGLRTWEVVVISIHAPHAGRDRGLSILTWGLVIFQSTRPMRGATIEELTLILSTYFNPRAPCGARPN